MIFQVLIWLALALIVWAYVGFPLLLMVRGLIHNRPISKAPITPRVSFVIVAHNEAATIQAKLDNVYSLDYPSEKLEVIVASDGSDDGTNELVVSYENRGLRLLGLPRSGKIAALNAAVAQATGEILVFSDANSMYAPGTLRALVAPFADPTVGAVGGDQCYLGDGDNAHGGSHVASAGERLFWNFDRLLKTMQSAAGSMISATGAVHAIRRELFHPVPPGVSDDFVISTRAILQGYRLVFEPAAVAYETVAPTPHAEFHRKLRVITRGLRAMWTVRQLLNPVRYGFYAVQLASHKLLRWSVCWLLIVLFVASLRFLAAPGVYRWLAASQIVFYVCAACVPLLAGTPLAKHKTFIKLLGLPYFFCMANYAALRAWLQVCLGRRIDVWDSRRPANAG